MPRPEPDRADLRFQLSLAVLGAVCGAVFTTALAAFDTSTPSRVVGLVFGSTLPPFVEVVGRRRRLRVTAVLVLTGASLVFAYGGTNAFATAIGLPPALPPIVQVGHRTPPVPSDAPAPIDPPTSTHQPNSTDSEPTMSTGPTEPTPAPGIAVTPEQVGCDVHECDDVIVTSTGTAPLRVGTVEVVGAGREYVTASGCTGAVLAVDECTITITFDPRDAAFPPPATVVVNQNLPGPPTFVPVGARLAGCPPTGG